MAKQYKVILVLSVLLTSFIFRQEWLHDQPIKPYTVQQTLSEILLGGGFFTGLFFVFISGTVFLFGGIISRFRK